MPDAAKTTILIVEDEAIVAADLSSKLQRLGYTVSGSTACGEDALTLVQDQHPDLVLMDIRLAGAMDGITAAEGIRREYDVPVIYLTAHSDRATLDRAKRTEPFGYILKPFEELELETHIEMALYKHQAEQKLRESEARWRVTLESIGDAVITGDTDGRVTFLNPVAAALTGWTPAAALGQPVSHVFHIINEVTHQPSEDLVARVLQENCVVELANHTSLVTRSGREVPVEDSAAPITNASGQVTGVVIVFHDVTARRRAEEERERLLLAVEKHAAELDATLSSLATGLIIYNTNGVAVRMNNMAQQLLSPEIFFYTTVEERAHMVRWETTEGQPFPPEEIPVARALRGETTHNVVIAAPLPAGKLWISASAAPICTPDNQMLGVVASFVNITELHAIQEQMKTFMHMVSHDLRAPLTITNGHVTLLKEFLNESENRAVQMSIEAIGRAIKRMDVMIDDLVLSAQLEGGRLTITRTPVDLATWLPEYLQRSSAVLDLQRIQLNIPATLPPLSVDSDRLERILTNLLSNALKYADPGTDVKLQVQERAGDFSITVQDQGQGIAPQDIAHLFEKFYRANGNRKAKGIGLGLYITKHIVEAHGGHIEVASEVGKGSTFTVTFPRS